MWLELDMTTFTQMIYERVAEMIEDYGERGVENKPDLPQHLRVR